MANRAACVHLLAWLALAPACTAPATNSVADAGLVPDGALVPDAGLLPDAGSQGPDASLEGEADAGQHPGDGGLEWSPCPLDSALDSGQAQCAVATFPLVREPLSTRTIEVFVKRVPASQPRRGQVWILGGGPGYSSRVYEHQLAFMAAAAPDLDVYTLDHRGVDRSTPLQCPVAQQRGTACVQELLDQWTAEGLKGFSSVEAAKDVIGLIAGGGPPTGDVILYGISYGGLWLNRIAQLAPDLATLLIFDSPASPTPLATHDDWTGQSDEAGRRLLSLCAADPMCASHFDGDPYAAALAALDHVDACDAAFGHNRDSIQTRLWSALAYAETRALVPAMVARAQRCNAEDGLAFSNLRLRLGDLSAQAISWPMSYILYEHVRFSEMVAARASDQAVAERAAQQVFFYPDFESIEGPIMDTWTIRYAVPPALQRWAQPSSRMLFLNGVLDGTTPLSIARDAALHVPSATSQFIELDNGSHSLLNSGRANPQTTACAEQMVAAALLHPLQRVDDACAHAIAPLDFNPPGDVALGVANVWPD